MSIPNIGEVVLYTNKPLDADDYKANWQLVIDWLTAGTYDVSFNAITLNTLIVTSGFNITGNLVVGGNIQSDLIITKVIKAKDSDGIILTDKDDVPVLYVADGGKLGVKIANPFAGTMMVSDDNAGGIGGDFWINNADNTPTVNNKARVAFKVDGQTDTTPSAAIVADLINATTFETSMHFYNWNGSSLQNNATLHYDGALELQKTNVAPVVPRKNSIYANNICKAWAYIATGTVSFRGFNINSVSISVIGFETRITIQFSTPFELIANYATIATPFDTTVYDPNPFSPAGDFQTAVVRTQTNTAVSIVFWETRTQSIKVPNFANVVVFGYQT